MLDFLLVDMLWSPNSLYNNDGNVDDPHVSFGLRNEVRSLPLMFAMP